MSGAVHAFMQALSAAFPFDASLDALTAALYGGRDLLGPLLHLTGLAAAYAVLSRLALRRLAEVAVGGLSRSQAAKRSEVDSIHGFSRHTASTAAQDRGPAGPGARDRSVGPPPGLPAVRDPRHRSPRAGGVDAGHRAADDLASGRGGQRGRLAWHPRGAALRRAGRQGRVGVGRLRRRGCRAAGRAGPQAGAARAGRDHRRVPVRVHVPRPLRGGARGRRGGQRPHARAARQDRGVARRERRRCGRALRHDGRPSRRDPVTARLGGTQRRCPSSPTAPSSRRRSTARSARPPTRPRRSATGAATRWIRPTPARPCARP